MIVLLLSVTMGWNVVYGKRLGQSRDGRYVSEEVADSALKEGEAPSDRVEVKFLDVRKSTDDEDQKSVTSSDTKSSDEMNGVSESNVQQRFRSIREEEETTLPESKTEGLEENAEKKDSFSSLPDQKESEETNLPFKNAVVQGFKTTAATTSDLVPESGPTADELLRSEPPEKVVFNDPTETSIEDNHVNDATPIGASTSPEASTSVGSLQKGPWYPPLKGGYGEMEKPSNDRYSILNDPLRERQVRSGEGMNGWGDGDERARMMSESMGMPGMMPGFGG